MRILTSNLFGQCLLFLFVCLWVLFCFVLWGGFFSRGQCFLIIVTLLQRLIFNSVITTSLYLLQVKCHPLNYREYETNLWTWTGNQFGQADLDSSQDSPEKRPKCLK